jgi:hypothetical protein
MSSGFGQNWGNREPARGRPAPRPGLSERRVGDGEVVQDRFIRLLARRVSRQAIGRIGRRLCRVEHPFQVSFTKYSLVGVARLLCAQQ